MLYNITYVLNNLFGEPYGFEENPVNQNPVNRFKNRLDEKYVDSLAEREIIPSQILPTFDADSPDLVEEMTKPRRLNGSFVIRGLIKNFDCYRKWNLDYFAENFGDTKITVFSDGKETLNSRLGFCRRELIELSINDFVRRLQNGENLYFNNASEIFYKHRQIVDDMELPRLNQTFGRTLDFSINHIFFGRKGGGSALHCANTSNFFFNTVGRKHWVLIEPQYSRFLRPVPSKDGMFSVSKMDCFDTSEDNPLLKLPRYEIILEPGDMLFNAHWWWHGVSNLSDFSIAVANRWTNHPVHMLANNLFYSHLVFYHPSTMSDIFSLMFSNLTGRNDGSRNASYEKNHLDALANTKGK
ncbi:MAG: hypothetical protein DSY87_00140 [Methylococcus sp.]|jgi:hypothetical protein|nr:MAG: hypothetical protein DSY87_00140 [Methylococcus sp.]